MPVSFFSKMEVRFVENNLLIAVSIVLGFYVLGVFLKEGLIYMGKEIKEGLIDRNNNKL